MTRILTLYPDTFLWEDGVSGLLYNAKNYQSYEFLLMPFLSDLSHRLLDFPTFILLTLRMRIWTRMSGFSSAK